MKYQNRDWWCGPTAIQNALRALGRRVGQESIAALCGTTEEGSDESDLLRGLGRMEIPCTVFEDSDPKVARYWLDKKLNQGYPVLLCVDHWDHWVCVIGAAGDRYILIDSERTPNNLRENGVHVLVPKTVLRRWRAGRKVCGGGERFYAIALVPEPS